MKLRAVSLSRKGEKSEQNEDACVALPGQGVFVVADGVGGNPSGEQASRDVVETLYDELKDAEIGQESIITGIDKANQVVHQNSLADERSKGMASTLVLAWIKDDKLFCYSVGDSRIYRFRDRKIFRLTKDHVKAVRRGSGTKNMVTRAMGLKADVLPDVTEWDWLESDVLLLSSDGISDQLSDESIEKIVTHDALSMTDKAKTMVEESERLGGRDDKTVVLVF